MRVFVTGPTGSGKSTFAALVAAQAGLPLYAMDDLHWERRPGGDVRRSPADRLALLLPLVAQPAWVIEGVQFKWADPAMLASDCIVVLDIPRWRNAVRVLRRFAARRRAGRGNPRASWAALREELAWSRDYYREERALLFEKLRPYRDKLIVIRHKAQARRVLDDIRAPA